jgi:hypothetical protein
MLSSRPCIWAGHGFLSPEHVVFEDPARLGDEGATGADATPEQSVEIGGDRRRSAEIGDPMDDPPPRPPRVGSAYLCRGLTAELQPYAPLLRALGVRNAFTLNDYAHANACFVRDHGLEPLPSADLLACVHELQARDHG